MSPNASLEDREVPTVREDPDLIPYEKETSINFTKGDDRADIFSAERGITRRLLGHDLFDIEAILLKDGSRANSIQSLDTSADVVVGIRGTLPIDAVKLKADARSARGHASVVSNVAGDVDTGGGDDQ
jgi:hypothetical protein